MISYFPVDRQSITHSLAMSRGANTLGLRNGFVRFVRKVFAHKKSPPGKFWVFVPPLYMKEDIE